MAENSNQVTEISGGTPGWVGPAIAVLAILSVAGLGYAWYDSNQLQSAQEAFAHLMHSHRAHPPVLGGPETPVVSSSGQPVAGSGGVNVIA